MTDRDALEFLGSAAELLSGPDPGPTPFVVEDLLVENGIGALVGPYKRGKTFLLLDMARSASPAVARCSAAWR